MTTTLAKSMTGNLNGASEDILQRLSKTEEIITPEIAGDWLALSGSNRRIKPALVARLARDMTDGRWLITGEAIKFDQAGRLMDGQHRLSAVLMSGVTITSVVVRGVAAEAFDVMDSGLVRTPADVLAIHGYRNDRNLASSAIALLIFERTGSFRRPSQVKDFAPSKPEVLAYVQTHPDLYDSVLFVARAMKAKLLPRATLVAVHYLFTQVDQEAANIFFDRLGSGVGLQATDPIYRLRERFTGHAMGTNRASPNEIAALTIKAWNAWRQGKAMKALSWRSAGPAAEDFPVIL